MVKYTKKENEDYKALQKHLKVLEQRSKRLRLLISARKKKGYYNISAPSRILRKVKTAKLNIAEAEFL